MTTTAIRPIETRYAGHRFRSRLEARWAVFFDALDIEWHYEPQGYVIDGTPYLPDFWLPKVKVWVEVKGVMSVPDLRTLLRAASASAGLPESPDGPALDPTDRRKWADPRILVLGQPPDEDDRVYLHRALCQTADNVEVGQFFFYPLKPSFEARCGLMPVGPHWHHGELGGVIGQGNDIFPQLRQTLVTALMFPYGRQPRVISDAYRAARGARFEYGESGWNRRT